VSSCSPFYWDPDLAEDTTISHWLAVMEDDVYCYHETICPDFGADDWNSAFSIPLWLMQPASMSKKIIYVVATRRVRWHDNQWTDTTIMVVMDACNHFQLLSTC
jgi:hypothetical protein